ncbi:MAG: malectin domain-containing carbohydrate-binding protein [bacterium]
MKKHLLIVLFTSFCFTLAYNSSFGQSLFQGPATGSIAAGSSVSTADFAAAAVAAVAPKRVLEKDEHEIPLFPDPPNLVAPTGPAGSNVVFDKSSSISAAAATAPTILSSFLGIPDAGAVIPPDPHMAAGPNHLLACVNQEFRIFDKLGNQVFQVAAASWFDNVLAGTSPCDPQVVYDDLSGRWIMIWIECGSLSPSLLLSVSDDSDPLGTWFNWRIPGDQNGDMVTGFFNDFPKIGVDQDAIYVTANMFDIFFEYVQLRIIPKAQLLNNDAGPVTWTDFWDLRDPGSLATTVVTVVPSVDFGDAGAQDNTEYLINDSPFVTGTFMTLWTLTDPLGAQTLTAVDVPVVSSTDPPDADQLGGSTTLIDVGGRRVRNAVYRDGSIWSAHSIAGGTGDAFAFARYVRIDVNSATALEDVAFGQDDFWYFYPAIEVDSGLNMVMGFSRSGVTEYAGAFFTGRLDTDPPGLADAQVLKAGEDNYVKTFGGTRNRWGDYNGIALDPTSGTIWMFTEYAALAVGPGVDDDRWGTWFGEVSLSGGTDVPPTITSTPNTTATVDTPYAYDDNNTVEAAGTAPITFSLVSGPPGFTVASDGLVTWTPTINDTGTQNVQIMASNNFGSDTQTFDIVVSEAPPPSAAQFRINAGGNDFTDSNGDLFVADKAFVAGDFGFSGGASNSTTNDIAGTTDDPLYQNWREDGSSFSYIFDGLSVDDYTVTLFFQEPFARRAGRRVFDVVAEGTVFLDNFDIFAQAGQLTAHTETFTVNVSDGQLNLDFQKVSGGPALVCGVSVVGSAPPVVAPDITVSPLSLDFGDVDTSATSDLTVTITNDGNADLQVSGLTTTNSVFSVVSPATPVTIVPAASEIVTVRFSPTAAGVQTGDLEITSDDPDEGLVTVSLTGNGVVPPPDAPNISVNPTSLDFGQVTVDSTSDAIVTITNDGTQILTVSDLSTTNTVFSVVSPATPFDVAANGGTQDVTLRFAPTATGVQSGDLNITSNDPDQGVLAVPLTGEGVTAPPPVSAFRINSGGGDFTDSNGDLFVADKAFTAGDFGFQGGSTNSTSNAISGTTDDPLYQDFREGNSFSYLFDLANGDYDVTAFFMEPRVRRTGRRVFDVLAEGVVVVNDLDIFAVAGQLAAHTESFTVNVADGQLNIDFEKVSGAAQPLVCAIAVVPVTATPALAARLENQTGSETQLIQTSAVPDKFELSQNYPNPFNPETTIRYSVHTGMHVTLQIYNLLGQVVRTLVDAQHEAGVFSVVWNGQDGAGNKVTSGVYIYQLKGEGFVETRKMILLQ